MMGTGLTFRCIYGIENRIPARFTLPYSIESRVRLYYLSYLSAEALR